MRWPSGNVFQELLQDGLDQIPAGVSATREGWVPLHEWRKYSGLSVVSSTKKTIIITANQWEYAGAMAGELESWADREAEISVQIWRACQSATGLRDSWLLVTEYYWAVFCITFFLRVIGKPIVRLDGKDIEDLKRLAAPGSQFPSGGTFRISKTAQTASTIQLEIKHVGSNYHKALWSQFYTCIRATHRKWHGKNANVDEDKLLEYLTNLPRLGDAWASDLRNSINYRSGSGFSASITNGINYDVGAKVRGISALNLIDLLTMLHAISPQCQSISSIDSNEKNLCRLLLAFSCACSALARDLYAEIRERRGFDRRWGAQRERFREHAQFGAVPTDWPFAA